MDIDRLDTLIARSMDDWTGDSVAPEMSQSRYVAGAVLAGLKISDLDLTHAPNWEIRKLKERIFEEEVRRELPEQRSRTITADLHNGGYIHVRGSATSIDMLWPILVDAPIVKSLQMHEGEGYGRANTVRIGSLNYTQLKAHRDGRK